MRPWVKVCGITRAEDARAAVEAGARAVGFILAEESPRRVDVETAADIARELPPGVARVGVVVSRSVAEIRDLVRRIGLTAIQAHGDETVEACRAYGVPTVKAFSAGEDFDPESLVPYREFSILLDGYSRKARGGTGTVADWTAARKVTDAGYRVVLAGGLGPENLVDAVRAVAPVAVDLNSGVERAPGIKDPERIRAALGVLGTFDDQEETPWPW